LIIGAFLVFIFMAMPSGRAPDLDDNLRSGQAQHAATNSVAASKPATTKYNNKNSVGNNNDDDQDGEEITAELTNAHDEIEKAEVEELEKEKSVLDGAIQTAGDFVQIGLTKLLGDTDTTEEEIKEMVKEVENKLTEEVNEELESTAEKLIKQAEARVDDTVANDEDNGYGMETIRDDMVQTEERVIYNAKSQLDETADRMRKQMLKKAQELEKEILEKRLSERLGKQVKLIILDDEVQDVDHLLDGLTTLKKGSTEGKSKGSSNNAVASTEGRGSVKTEGTGTGTGTSSVVYDDAEKEEDEKDAAAKDDDWT